MRDFIERLQAKPEHTRRQIAFLSSALITVVVAVGWVAAVASSGSLALSPSPSGNSATFGSTNSIGTMAKEARSGFDDLLGAVGAAGNGTKNVGALTIVDGEASSTLDRHEGEEERTVIPF